MVQESTPAVIEAIAADCFDGVIQKFATTVELDRSTLSRILSGKRNITVEQGKHIFNGSPAKYRSRLLKALVSDLFGKKAATLVK